jgi:hypothetical protein
MRTFPFTMRTFLLVSLLACLQTTAFGQTPPVGQTATVGQIIPIRYDIPSGLETAISQEDYHFLVDTSIAAVEERFRIDSVSGGTIRLAKGQELGGFNLDNLILQCAAVKDRTAWPAIIRDHFHLIFSLADQQLKIDPANYWSVRQYLSLRIYPQDVIDQRGGPDALVTRVDLEGTYTVLMLDIPDALAPLQKSVFDGWKRNKADVFRTAQNNVDSQRVEKVSKTSDFDGTPLEVTVLDNEDYAASYALDLGKVSPELVGDWGSAVAIPNKGLVSICKISPDKPADFVKFIQLTKAYMERAYQQGPQRISDQYFWYYQGTFTRIRVEVDGDGNVNVVAPYGLAQLMAKKP